MSLTYAVGDTVIHPHHGAATIDDVEQRELNGDQVEYVVLTSPFNDLTLKVPVSRVEDVGIRACMSTERLTEVVAVLEDEPTPQKGHWSRRLKRNQSRMRSGEPAKLAMVVRDLTAKLNTKGLSPAERRIHRTSRRMLHGEIAAVVDGGAEAADALLDEALLRHMADDDTED
ncbi:CarD family transcriptional regulator [Salsipaludibacter albus]|uniref:CarD family transcriptional regulator n=1 Tax=Salsipaludibacter albus TaxID=2849650 RepID=UPI001EE3FECF|nr:CarD family transcriptional regulator [Salsipaludibacter albus]MBY5162695.1 CarD family transcriptional regulator [Salsipaludibacter albus]